MVNLEPLYFGHLYLPIQPNLPGIGEAFMRNEPNFRNAEMNVNKVLTKDYEDFLPRRTRKNEPKTNPIKAKTNPIQTQYGPETNPIKPNQSQFQRTKANYCHLSDYEIHY